MARRHIRLTLDITLDEDLCRDADQPYTPDGDTHYNAILDTLRTTVHHNTAVLLANYDPALGPVTVADTGITY